MTTKGFIRSVVSERKFKGNDGINKVCLQLRTEVAYLTKNNSIGYDAFLVDYFCPDTEQERAKIAAVFNREVQMTWFCNIRSYTKADGTTSYFQSIYLANIYE